MTTRDRTLLAIVGGLAIIALYWFALLGPARSDADKTAAEVATARAALQAERDRITAGLNAKRGYRQATAQIARLSQAIPDNEDVPSLVESLDRAAGDERVSFNAVTADAAADATQPLPVLPFTFTFNGRWAGLTDFFARLHRQVKVRQNRVDANGRLLTIDDIEITTEEGGLTAKVKASAYLSPAEPAAGTPAGPGQPPPETSPPGNATADAEASR